MLTQEEHAKFQQSWDLLGRQLVACIDENYRLEDENKRLKELVNSMGVSWSEALARRAEPVTGEGK